MQITLEVTKTYLDSSDCVGAHALLKKKLKQISVVENNKPYRKDA